MTLPTGVASIHVVAVGGRGGGLAGGFGAVVTGDVNVLPPDLVERSPRLLVRVAGNGAIGAGGFNGGGDAGVPGLLPTFAGGGGGASTVAPFDHMVGNVSVYVNKVLAAGGGGAGAPTQLGAEGGAGGSAGAAGAGSMSMPPLFGAAGGLSGNTSGAAGGLGATSSESGCDGGEDGEDGAPRAGGAGGLSADDSGHGDGGGGGSGTIGGGGGGAGGFCSSRTATAGGGGGGGSSNVPAGGTIATDSGGQPSVQITYTVEHPTVVIYAPVDGATYALNRSIAASYQCTAPAALPQDTIVSCTGNSASGENLATGQPGDYAFTVTATDAYGLTASQTIHYRVTAPLRKEDDADRTRPAIHRLQIQPGTIDLGSAHAYATVSFRLSERARVLVGIRRVRASASRARRHRAREIAGQAGRNQFKLPARTGGRTLRAGTYQLTLVAVDRAGNRSRPAAARFSVVD